MSKSNAVDPEQYLEKDLYPRKSKSITEIAQEVIEGKWGVGNDRFNRLNQAGYSADQVQSRVNLLLTRPKKTITEMAREIIDGEHGNGHDNRMKSLGLSKSEYNKVRNEVNRLVSGKSIDKMAEEVIAGKHGNGHENRRKSLGISASEYAKVRAEVNKRV